MLIGVCVSNEKRKFRAYVKERLKLYSGNAELIAFRMKDLDLKRKRVKGEYLKKKGKKIHRVKGVYPLPAAIYVQTYVHPRMLKKLEKAIGRKVFNNFICDKWQCSKLLFADTELQAYLPYTRKLKDLTSVQKALDRYRDVILKPINAVYAYGGKGIIRVRLEEDNQIEAYYWSSKGMNKKIFTSYNSLWKFLLDKRSDDDYIVQQFIPTMKVEDNATDIRLHMNRDGSGQWVVSDILLRVATNESHLSHQLNVTLEIDYLDNKFPQHQGEADESYMKESIIKVGLMICRAFDHAGYHMGDLGIDIGVDENGHPWVFEVNTLPNPYPSYNYAAFTYPIEYALYLAAKKKKT